VRLAVIVACAAHFLIGADGLSVAIALPAIRDDLGADAIEAQWVLTAFGLTFGGGLLLGGRLGDLYGRRRMLRWGMGLFGAGALAAAAAPGLGVLVAARAVQGLGAAAAMPAALALIGSLVPEGPERTRALATMGAMASVGVMSGLVAGGLLIELLGWRSVFAVMAVPALVTAVGAPLAVAETRAQERLRPDVPGAVLVTAAAVAVLFGVTRVEHHGVMSAAVLLPVLAGAALLAAFVAWERRAPAPLVRFEVLALPSLRTATVAVGANAVAFTAIVYVGTLYFQDALGYTALEAALAVLPLDVVAFVVAVAGAGLIVRRSPRALLALGFAASALALLWLARAPVPATYALDVLGPLLVLGASLAVCFVVTTQLAVAEAAPDDKGLASGIFETANHLLGGAVGGAVEAAVLAATSYGTAFLVAAGLAAAGALSTRRPLARR
jgi:MFS family permease